MKELEKLRGCPATPLVGSLPVTRAPGVTLQYKCYFMYRTSNLLTFSESMLLLRCTMVLDLILVLLSQGSKKKLVTSMPAAPCPSKGGQGPATELAQDNCSVSGHKVKFNAVVKRAKPILSLLILSDCC